MYRSDHEAARARLDAVQRELDAANAAAGMDKQRIAALSAELAAARKALASLGAAQPGVGPFALPSRAAAVLTLGILSIVCCAIMGPIAWSMGNEELRRIDHGLAPPFGRSNANAGRICGIVGTALLAVGLLAFFAGIITAASAHP